jgi:hypothetical protein
MFRPEYGLFSGYTRIAHHAATDQSPLSWQSNPKSRRPVESEILRRTLTATVGLNIAAMNSGMALEIASDGEIGGLQVYTVV